MKLVVYNGSPRGQHGNSLILAREFLKGFTRVPENEAQVFHLTQVNHLEERVEAFGGADAVLLIFPLYTDGMPGLVKAFIEALEPYVGRPNNPPLAFMIHSGFPEATHLRALETYLQKLARRLGCPYLGTVIRPGTEGIQVQPDRANQSLYRQLQDLGESFARTRQLDPALVKRMAGPERLPVWLAPLLFLADWLGLTKMYWDGQLRQHGAYARRFARPYQKEN